MRSLGHQCAAPRLGWGQSVPLRHSSVHSYNDWTPKVPISCVKALKSVRRVEYGVLLFHDQAKLNSEVGSGNPQYGQIRDQGHREWPGGIVLPGGNHAGYGHKQEPEDHINARAGKQRCLQENETSRRRGLGMAPYEG